MALPPEQSEYLKSHTQGIFATGKRDGSPQLSTINYRYDGEQILLSATLDRAKFKNAMRNKSVCLLVPGANGSQVVVYGKAEGITEPMERTRLTRYLREVGPNPAGPDEAAYHAMLEEQKRVVIRIIPERAFLTIM